MYPNPRVASFITANFITARIHIKEQPAPWHRFRIRWTPTVLVLAPDGTEQRRIEGYLPADEMLAQLTLALGYVAVARKDWSAAESYFASVPERYPGTEAAPEGLYWAGVARYSGSHDGAALKELNRVFTTRYSDTAWAKRTAVWSS